MEVPFIIAAFGYICLGICMITTLLVLFFLCAPSSVMDHLASRASKGETESAQAWAMCTLTLAAALAVDSVGCGSFLLPGIGEASDVIWAPISAFGVKLISGGSYMWTAMAFIEEILPFTDIIPTATFAWATRYWPFIFLTLHKSLPTIRWRTKAAREQ
eukprot:TRINITY_DN111999_c0_g1_i1.p1 TRINITY_DN111999_c0_g1~~TRINITY_DN111999_c0_g1_i1.p1  ORF type:complete len:159 (+),score=12.51 TRINITY_DN111999_c0_g1_i1:113-589(+)